jgi:tetratricopeptide (TPR) repeat protein
VGTGTDGEAPRTAIYDTPEVDPLAQTERGEPASGAPDQASLPPGTAVGRFVVLSSLGAGGGGVVYAAYDRELDRRIALKFVRPHASPQGDTARARLVREAQALARVDHPNVVAVHDIGSFGDEVFLAHALVEGSSLREWMGERRRRWREVVEVFAQAARGLAAAHRAGIVHRDFKPENVLIGRDGRVQVTDFGLARAVASGDEPTPDEAATPAEAPVASTTADDGRAVASASTLSLALTQDGTLLGTPHYMAPEQLLGQRVDARTDQFSFCVAIYEALHGERPFAGADLDDLRRHVCAGEVRPAPEGADVPGWLRRVVLRGLAAEPAARYPSMEALLRDLQREPARRWRRALAAVGALVVVGAVVAGARGYRSQVCSGAQARLAGVWDPARRQAVASAFRATGKPFADGAWRGVERVLDRYAGDWAVMHEEACRATRVRGEQSEALLDRRMLCLAQRRVELKALVDVLARADAPVVERAAQASASLAPLSACADVTALMAPVAPPRDAAARASVEAVRARIAEANALNVAGKYRDGLPVATAAAAAAAQVDYPPVRAEALVALADLQNRTGDARAAEATLREAATVAAAAHDDATVAQALVMLVQVIGANLGRHAEGLVLRLPAELAIARAGGDRIRRAELLNALANVEAERGAYEAARQGYEQSLAIVEGSLGADHPRAAAVLGNLGTVLAALGRHEQAVAAYERALRIAEARQGPEHPALAMTLSNLAEPLAAEGRFGEAVGHLRRGLAIVERGLGTDDLRTAALLSNLGTVHLAEGRPRDALPFFLRALEIKERRAGREHPSMVSTLHEAGLAHVRLGDADRARVLLERALDLALRTLGPDAPDLAAVHQTFAELLGQQRRHAAMLEHARGALAIDEKALGRDHPAVAIDLTLVGQAQLGLGRAGAAVASLERALAIRKGRVVPPREDGETRFALARALWVTGGDRARALALAAEASSAYSRLKGPEAAAVAGWRQTVAKVR